MKFHFGDIVYNVSFLEDNSTGIDYMQVMEYDENMQKYKCISFDALAPQSFFTIIYFKEEDIDFIDKVDPIRARWYLEGGPIFPKNLDDNYYDIYEFDGKKQKLIRKAFRHWGGEYLPRKTKFNFGDIVYYVPLFNENTDNINYLQVMEYDVKKVRYKCIFFDHNDPIASFSIYYLFEQDLDFAHNISKNVEKKYKPNGKVIFPKNIDEDYIDVYDFVDGKRKLIKKAIKQRKDGELPLKKSYWLS
ncbi:MAG: hypothetical protein J1F32_04895 [Erysipelotrichales bacterium]|nr:hypothetical protein [Erysipelotrichales bacterium]